MGSSPIRHDPRVPAFRGFPPEALEFLSELEANNDRDWFKANRARYDEHLVAPARALGEARAERAGAGARAAGLSARPPARGAAAPPRPHRLAPPRARPVAAPP